MTSSRNCSATRAKKSSASITACWCCRTTPAPTNTASSGRTSGAASRSRARSCASARAARDIWLRASYTPIRDETGRVSKIVKYAVDISWQLLLNYDFEGQIKAIRASQAVCQFEPDGRVIEANDIFLDKLGYKAADLIGQHHRLLVDRNYHESSGVRPPSGRRWVAVKRNSVSSCT